MARPGFAKNLPKLPIEPERVQFPRTKQAPEHNRGRGEEPNVYTQMASKYGPRLQNLAQDLEYDPSSVSIQSTYFKTYVKTVYSGGFDPLVVLYCHYCWNNWPVVGFMALDKISMQRFVRGQCCPYCEKREDRRNINQMLMTSGPSHFFIEQAQKVGLRTDRFPFIGVDPGPVRFQDVWSTNSPCHPQAREWWDNVGSMRMEPNPDA